MLKILTKNQIVQTKKPNQPNKQTKKPQKYKNTRNKDNKLQHHHGRYYILGRTIFFYLENYSPKHLDIGIYESKQCYFLAK